MTGQKRDKNSRINIGIIGIGAMGKGLLYQSCISPGIKCNAVCDINVQRCIDNLKWLGLDYRVAGTPAEMHNAVERGLVAVCEDGMLLSQCEMIDALIESSNTIIPAARFAMEALHNRKHLILMNSEIDLIFGPYLLNLARDNNVVYTSCDGDQYGVIKHLIDDLKLWGFELVMAGNIKGFLNRYANPENIIPEADKRNLDYYACTSYTDGTKLSIEMALTANALNLETRVPGMYGPRAAHVQDVLRLFDFDSLWASRIPFVDYILGAEPGGGVFAVGYCGDKYQRDMLSYYKMGDGPYYVFYRPYHLCHIEAMSSVYGAVLENRPVLQPDYGFQTNVYAYAKRDLKRGESLDGIGGFTCYGLIENSAENINFPGLPVCLASDVILKRDVARDEKIYMKDISYDHNRLDFKLFSQAQEHSGRSVAK